MAHRWSIYVHSLLERPVGSVSLEGLTNVTTGDMCSDVVGKVGAIESFADCGVASDYSCMCSN